MRSGQILKHLPAELAGYEYLAGRDYVERATGELVANTSYKENSWTVPPRVARCGWTLGDAVGVAKRGNTAHFSMTEHCSSIWACPECSATIRATRADEIKRAVTSHQEQGGNVLFLTLTIRHYQADSLDISLNAILEGWRKLINGSPWKRQTARHSISGYIRSTEVTLGENGWHPHVHALLFLDSPMSSAALDDFEDWLFERWANKVTDLCARRPSRENGIRLVNVGKDGKALSDYLAKVQDEGKQWDVGNELARGDVKTGRTGSIVPFELLDEENHLFSREQSFHLWREYYLATKGRRCISWSRGLKKRFGIDDISDEEIMEETESGDLVYFVNASDYRRLLHEQPEALAFVLDFVEQGRLDLAQAILPERWQPDKPRISLIRSNHF